MLALPIITVNSVSCIWKRGAHNAFTDLCQFEGQLWLVFREAEDHVSPDGQIIVLSSTDGKDWQHCATLALADRDLRDPKIIPTPDGELLISCAGVSKQAEVYLQTYLYTSSDGHHWSSPKTVGKPNSWIWRTRFIDGQGFGVGYEAGREETILYTLDNKNTAKVHRDPLFSKAQNGLGYPNESDLFQLPSSELACLLRRDADTASAQLGIAKAPYKEWLWQDLGVRIGGPVVLALRSGVLLAAVRLYEPARTSLCLLDIDGVELTEILSFPSGGDTSYAGLVERNGLIFCSYYSSHEGAAAIYIAELKIG